METPQPFRGCGVLDFQTVCLLLERFELVLTDSAQRTYPIVGNVFERRSCGNTSVWIAYGGIINPVADRATILFHTLIFFEFKLFQTNVTSFFGKTKSEIPIPASAKTIAVPNRRPTGRSRRTIPFLFEIILLPKFFHTFVLTPPRRRWGSNAKPERCTTSASSSCR